MCLRQRGPALHPLDSEEAEKAEASKKALELVYSPSGNSEGEPDQPMPDVSPGDSQRPVDS